MHRSASLNALGQTRSRSHTSEDIQPGLQTNNPYEEDAKTDFLAPTEAVPRHESFPRCAVFWDYENAPPPSGVPGYIVVECIRRAVYAFGSIIQFKAYLQVTESAKKTLRSELQSSGVSLIDAPHNSRKDAADKMILVDLMSFAMDHPPPTTIVLISGDRDYVYALSVLRNRRYNIVCIAPSNASVILRSQANTILDWKFDVLNQDLVSSLLADVARGRSTLTPSTSRENLPSETESSELRGFRRSPSRNALQVPGSGCSTPTARGSTNTSPKRSLHQPASDDYEDRKRSEDVGSGPSFDLLVDILNEMKLTGELQPKRVKVAQVLVSRCPELGAKGAVEEYMIQASQKGVVGLGGFGGNAVIHRIK
ncbi:NYN domain-containing protein [Cladochytrium replicatum]|nr:NYN domain-containing protein [Cladochytrium replicatum]